MAKKIPRLLPSEHAAARAKDEAGELLAREAARRREARVRGAFDWLLKQENGRIVWGWLFDRCGYNKPGLLRLAAGDVAALSTEAAAAQREVYRDLRKMVAPDLLAKAEYEAEFGEEQPKKGESKDA